MIRACNEETNPFLLISAYIPSILKHFYFLQAHRSAGLAAAATSAGGFQAGAHEIHLHAANRGSAASHHTHASGTSDHAHNATAES